MQSPPTTSERCGLKPNLEWSRYLVLPWWVSRSQRGSTSSSFSRVSGVALGTLRQTRGSRNLVYTMRYARDSHNQHRMGPSTELQVKNFTVSTRLGRLRPRKVPTKARRRQRDKNIQIKKNKKPVVSINPLMVTC